VRSDPTLLERMLKNLLTKNAIRFNNRRGKNRHWLPGASPARFLGCALRR